MSSLFACMQARPTVKLPETPPPNTNNGANVNIITLPRRRKDKVVVVVGSTGTGKSRLSVDVATRFGGEVINSDKIQVYKGLDIIANKNTEAECRGVPHHLFSFVDPDDDFTAEDFVRHASLAAESVIRRGRIPVVAGGSVSLVKALVENHAHLYDFCFLWVDVSMHVLNLVLSKRVDKMVERGLVEEVRPFYRPDGDYSRGVRRSIGVPEMDIFFRNEVFVNEGVRADLLEASINEIKANTHRLACNQLQKIMRLPEDLGMPPLLRLDSTPVFQARGVHAVEEWMKVVWKPSTAALSDFLSENKIEASILSHCN